MRYVPVFVLMWSLFACDTADGPKNSDEVLSKTWRAVLYLDDAKKNKLPFLFEWDSSDDSSAFVLINGPERIVQNRLRKIGDSLIVSLDPYESELHLEIKGKQIKGVWKNFAKGPEYQIPLAARNGVTQRFLDISKDVRSVAGNYQVTFGAAEDSYPGLAELSQLDHIVLGTIRTETGDYRYLEGIQTQDKLMLSCFDGAHAFLFQSEVDSLGNLIDGHFYSGNHYHEIWSAVKNDTFDLIHPDSLTYIQDVESGFNFNILLENGDTLTEKDPRFNNKVVLIQIMGTWCPNCKDESEYLQRIHKSYGSDDLEIIAVGFENEKEPANGRKRVLAYKMLMNLPYDIYYGGSSRKELVNLRFPALSEIKSYPTLIVIDKAGNVAKIHTGFNGPATSKYQNFEENMSALLDSLTAI